MAKQPEYPFDPTQIMSFLKGFDPADMMEQLKKMDPAGLFEAQQKNMAALQDAGNTFSEGYQALFKKQVAAVEQALSAAQSQASSDPSEMARSMGSSMTAAFEKAVENMTMLSQEAQNTNSDVVQKLSARVEESIAEMQDLVRKFSGQG